MNRNLTDWVRHHHRYGAAGFVDTAGRFRPAQEAPHCCHAPAESHR